MNSLVVNKSFLYNKVYLFKSAVTLLLFRSQLWVDKWWESCSLLFDMYIKYISNENLHENYDSVQAHNVINIEF